MNALAVQVAHQPAVYRVVHGNPPPHFLSVRPVDTAETIVLGTALLLVVIVYARGIRRASRWLALARANGDAFCYLKAGDELRRALRWSLVVAGLTLIALFVAHSAFDKARSLTAVRPVTTQLYFEGLADVLFTWIGGGIALAILFLIAINDSKYRLVGLILIRRR